MFDITLSSHNQYCIEIANAPTKLHCWLRGAVLANHIDDPFYLKKQEVTPFLQGGSNRYNGWILIEFWTRDLDKIREYVAWLNEEWVKFDQTHPDDYYDYLLDRPRR